MIADLEVRLLQQWRLLTARAKPDWGGLEAFLRDVLSEPGLTDRRRLELMNEALAAWTGRGEETLAPHV